MYPKLPLEIILFFSQQEIKGERIVTKEIGQFCDDYATKYKTSTHPQPGIISKMCDILCDSGKLSLIRKAGWDNINSSYYGITREEVKSVPAVQIIINTQLSCLIYGFKYIYEEYSK